MRKYINLLIAVATLVIGSAAYAGIAVIVHPSAGIDALSADDIARIFLGKTKKFPNGQEAIPINQNEGSPVREKFNQAILKKTPSQYKAYWSRLVFTGKGTPPKDSGTDADVKALVAANPNVIGYVDSSVVDSSVKVVFELP